MDRCRHRRTNLDFLDLELKSVFLWDLLKALEIESLFILPPSTCWLITDCKHGIGLVQRSGPLNANSVQNVLNEMNHCHLCDHWVAEVFFFSCPILGSSGVSCFSHPINVHLCHSEAS